MAIVKIVNWEGGSNARYDVSQMTDEERKMFDEEGRPLFAGAPGDGPDQWTPGLPGARGGSGPGDMGGVGPQGQGGGASAYAAQLKSMLAAASAADLAGTKSAIQQALIGFGLVPEGFKDELGALDDTTLALIKKNTDTGISGWARMQEAAKDREKSLLNRLSSAGLRRTGTKGAKLRRGQLDKDRMQTDAIAALLADVGGKYQGYAQNEQNRQMQMLQALFSSPYSSTVGPGAPYTPKPPSSPGGSYGYSAPPTYAVPWGSPGYGKPILGTEEYENG